MLQWRVDGQGKGKPGLPALPCFSYLCKSLRRVGPCSFLVLGAALCGGVSRFTKGCWPAGRTGKTALEDSGWTCACECDHTLADLASGE